MRGWSSVPEIKHQQLGGSPWILSAEIHIPNDSDLGTGTFTTAFKAKAFSSGSDIASIMMNLPAFQISATVNANGDIPVLIGRAEPQHQLMFVLPKGLDPAPPHTLRVEFTKWRIVAASIDGKQLAQKRETTSH